MNFPKIVQNAPKCIDRSIVACREEDSNSEAGIGLRRLLRAAGTGTRGTGSARDAPAVKNQRNTDRILGDLKMSDSPPSLHSSFL